MKKLLILCLVFFAVTKSANAFFLVQNNTGCSITFIIYAHDNSNPDCEFYISQVYTLAANSSMNFGSTKSLVNAYTASSGYTTTATPGISQWWDGINFYGYDGACGNGDVLSDNTCLGTKLSSSAGCNFCSGSNPLTGTWVTSGSNVTVTFSN